MLDKYPIFSFLVFFFSLLLLPYKLEQCCSTDRQTDTNKRANKETEKTTQPDTDVICM